MTFCTAFLVAPTRDTPSDFRACFTASPATSPAIAVEESSFVIDSSQIGYSVLLRPYENPPHQ
jgi:hypothetical protein